MQAGLEQGTKNNQVDTTCSTAKVERFDTTEGQQHQQNQEAYL